MNSKTPASQASRPLRRPLTAYGGVPSPGPASVPTSVVTVRSRPASVSTYILRVSRDGEINVFSSSAVSAISFRSANY